MTEFSADELEKFECRYENGYDLNTDERSGGYACTIRMSAATLISRLPSANIKLSYLIGRGVIGRNSSPSLTHSPP